MSEKAVSIGNYVVATGLDTYLGVDPYVSGSTEVASLLTEGVRDWVEAAYTVEKDIDKFRRSYDCENRRKNVTLSESDRRKGAINL